MRMTGLCNGKEDSVHGFSLGGKTDSLGES